MSKTGKSLPLHGFRRRDNILAKAAMRDKLLTHPAIRRMLNQQLLRLNLEGQVKAGIITPNQALVLYEKRIHDFSRKLHTAINQRYLRNNLDQTDLSNPINMALALNNPISFASEQMNAIAGALEEAQNQEAANNLAAQQNEAENQPQVMPESDSSSENKPEEFSKDEKYAALTAALVAVEDIGPSSDIAKDKIESAFFKHTGIESDFHKVEEERKENEDKPSFLKHELKPQHDSRGGDDDKRKG